ncbi:hypothetical protein CJU94_19675 [Paraburkholderia aromaticivorans]|uniref:Uncharacterized protein n=1 Tax=Paraburkholderia aromaticivorans TaxID=2026199 RepID=A0A248VP68_9BURK|nr:hypothetical protein CJU94_19675 [Paraburkholderia aromaticivorans]
MAIAALRGVPLVQGCFSISAMADAVAAGFEGSVTVTCFTALVRAARRGLRPFIRPQYADRHARESV